ncbi:MAG: hypothetical protein Q8P18_21335 [Pseudomonadota bacterium]|nr:hypothetical protein [Pseudomonadota bacterium]
MLWMAAALAAENPAACLTAKLKARERSASAAGAPTATVSMRFQNGCGKRLVTFKGMLAFSSTVSDVRSVWSVYTPHRIMGDGDDWVGAWSTDVWGREEDLWLYALPEDSKTLNVEWIPTFVLFEDGHVLRFEPDVAPDARPEKDPGVVGK